MPYRVREILLVSSTYDAFILGEDGRLTERLFAEYSEFNLTQAPRITHASNSQEALKMLKQRRFDLVMTMVRLEDTNVNAFGRMIKAVDPGMPVVLLIFNETDLDNFPGGIDHSVIDFSFLWRGDARILLTITKIVEDKKNVDPDVKNGDVRCILVVEDAVRRYSSFLTLLYSVIMSQSYSLISEGLNDLHKTFRMRARPKILLARTYEEAIGYYNNYGKQILALISDVNFPKDGERCIESGFELAQFIRANEPNIAILLQSVLSVNEVKAKKLGFRYVDKTSPHLHRKLKKFLIDELGFGSFIFRMPDGTEIAQAKDLYDMERIIKTVPAVSIEYHANKNNFSTWFCARSMFHLADDLRSHNVSDFNNVEELREYFLKAIQLARKQRQEGMITDFSSRQVGPESFFVRMGRGSVGGKGRGLAFLNSLISRHQIPEFNDKLQVRIPKSVCIGTDEFEKYMETNKFHEDIDRHKTDEEIIARFISGRLSDEHWEHLRFVLKNMEGPLAVRSSSILEDSQFQPFAGIYSTYMIPNNHPDPNVRFRELCSAIKAVYASLFLKNARSYIASTPHSPEEESMAVVIQQVVGQTHGDRYYPLISGVAQSYNYYPIGHQKAEDGIVQIVLGLGHSVVSGGSVIRFSPKDPQVLPQIGKPEDFLTQTQKDFYAIDLSKNTTHFLTSPDLSLGRYTLEDAEKDKTLQLVGSVYSLADNTIRENFRLQGPRVVSFNNILKWHDIPLAEVLYQILAIIRKEAGFAIEIEFAVDKAPGQVPVLNIVQMRPLAVQIMHGAVDVAGFSDKEILCRTDMSLGHGNFTEIYDIVYVKPKTADSTNAKKIAEHVGRLNAALEANNAGYLLIGPGRWGSSDPSLGIPVEWAEISGARIIAETSFENHRVDPSQGTHFFQNIIAKGIGYLTLSRPSVGDTISDAYLDMDWLEKQKVKTETEWVKHIRLKKPLVAKLDGRLGQAVVVKP
ncbi:MAG: PEP/pyruvate-binding domain-containing protein [bacterium]|nr:hypothetical protein [bacterium]